MHSTILDKIKKLHALSTSSNPNEAAVAASKMTDLLMAHNLTMADLDTHTLSEQNPYTREDGVVNSNDTSKSGRWQLTLAYVIAAHNFCSVVEWARNGHSRFVWIGRRDNVAAARFIHEQLCASLIAMCDVAWKEEAARLRSIGTKADKWKTYKTLYYRGAVHAIHARLVAQRAEALRASAATTMLVRTSEREVKEAVARFYPRVRTQTARVSTVKDAGAYVRGQQDGSNMSLQPGIGASRGSAGQLTS